MENDQLKEIVKSLVVDYAFVKTLTKTTCINFGDHFKPTFIKDKDQLLKAAQSASVKLTDILMEQMLHVETNGAFKDISRIINIDNWFALIPHIRSFRDEVKAIKPPNYEILLDNIKLFEEIVGKNIATILQKEISFKWLSVLIIRPKYFWCHFRSKTLTAIILTGTISGIINTVINVMSHLN